MLSHEVLFLDNSVNETTSYGAFATSTRPVEFILWKR